MLFAVKKKNARGRVLGQGVVCAGGAVASCARRVHRRMWRPKMVVKRTTTHGEKGKIWMVKTF